MSLTILIHLIVLIQTTISLPLFFDEIMLDQMEELYSSGKSLANMNQMLVIDGVEAKMKETPPFKGTNASEQFKDAAYAVAQLPGGLGDNVLDGIENIQVTLNESRDGVLQAFSKKAESTSDEGGSATPESTNPTSETNETVQANSTQPKPEDRVVTAEAKPEASEA